MRFSRPIHIASAYLHLPSDRDTVGQAVMRGALTEAQARWACCEEVRVSTPDIPAWRLAFNACGAALEEAKIDAARVGMLAYAGIGDEADALSPAYRIARLLGCHDSLGLGLDQLSNGGTAALQNIALALAADADIDHGLACTSGNFSTLPYDRWQIVPWAVQGDGATAAVLTTGTGPLELCSIASVGDATLDGQFPTFHPFRPLPADFGAPTDGAGFAANARAIRTAVARATRRALADTGLAEDDPRIAVVHPTRLGKLDARHTVIPALPGPLQDRCVVLGDDTGHLGPGDTIANLADLLRNDTLCEGQYALLITTAVGHTASCVVVRRTAQERQSSEVPRKASS